MTSLLHLSYRIVDEHTSTLIDKIKDSKKSFRYIVGIENGGVHISRKIASALNMEHKTVRISAYDDKGFKLRDIPIVSGNSFGSNCLIVDDLVDTGSTIKAYDNHFGLKDNSVAVLFWNKQSGYQPDYYVLEKNPGTWIVFPWE